MFKYHCILYVLTSSIEGKHLKNIFVWCIKVAPLGKKVHRVQFLMKILLVQYSFLWTGCGGTVYDESKVNPFLHILTFSLFFLSHYNVLILEVEFKAQNMEEPGKLICLNLVLKLEWSVSVSSPQGPCFIFYFIMSDQNILSTKRCLCFSSSQNYRNLKMQHKMYNYFPISFFWISL